MTTHIAALITAAHGKPVAIVEKAPTDEDLLYCAYSAYLKVRYPDAREDTGAIIHEAKNAVLEMAATITRLRYELKLEQDARRKAIDAFDEQSEECEAMRKELGR